MGKERKETSTNSLNEVILGDYCRFNEVIATISPRWKMQILFSIYEGTNRFSLLRKEYPSLSKQILGNRLKELERENFVSSQRDENTAPPSVIYYIEPKGISLLKLVPELCKWGDLFL